MNRIERNISFHQEKTQISEIRAADWNQYFHPQMAQRLSRSLFSMVSRATVTSKSQIIHTVLQEESKKNGTRRHFLSPKRDFLLIEKKKEKKLEFFL